MACQKVDIVLSIVLHTSSFGDNIAYILMILFETAFLIRYIRVAIKYACPGCSAFVLFDVPWVFKFRAIVSEYYRKVFFESTDTNSGARHFVQERTKFT